MSYKVSVVIPVYGVERYIERCVRSLFEQTLSDIEFLFIDDCTPDKSIDILRRLIDEYKDRLQLEHKQVRILRMPINSGQAAVRKFGILEAKGDYIIHCDSDDWVDKDMYMKLYNKAEEDNSDIVICDYYVSDSSNRNSVKACHSTNSHDFLVNVLLHKDVPALWNKLIKRKLYEKTNIIWPTEYIAEDLTLIAQLLYNSKKIAYIEKPLYYYFFNQSSSSNSSNLTSILNQFSAGCKNIEYILAFYEDKKVDNAIKDALVFMRLFERNRLLPIISHYRYWRLWFKTFPEINGIILLTKTILMRDKIKFIAAAIGIYPMYSLIKGLPKY